MVARPLMLLMAAFWLLGPWVLAAGPANDAFESAATINPVLPIQVPGNLDDAILEDDDPAVDWGGWTRSVWWKWKPPASGPVQIATSNQSQDLAVGLLADLGDGPELAAFNDDEVPGIEVAPVLRVSVVAGQTYWIGVVAGDDESGPFKLLLSSITNAPANDDFGKAAIIPPDLPATVSGTSVQASIEPFEPLHANEPIGHSVWWKWTPTVSTNVVIRTLGSNYDTLLGVYAGPTLSQLEEIDSNDDAGGGTATSSVRLRVSAGTTYFIAVDGFDNASGSIQLSIIPEPPLPAPDWALRSATGGDISWRQYSGKVVLLHFWATWCIPCAGEMPDFQTLLEELGADGLEVVGVAVDSDVNSQETVRLFVSQQDIPYDIVHDPQGTLGNLFGGLASLPTTFLIDRAGNIAEKYVGTQSLEVFENDIHPLLAEAVPVIPPVLTLVASGTSVDLAWEATGAEFGVVRAASLAGPWTPVAETPVRSGTRRELTVPVDGPAFFRLISP